MLSSRLIPSSLALLLLSAGALTRTVACVAWPTADADRPRLVLAELRERESNHAAACAGWTSLDDANDEPDSYVDDTYVLTDDMIEACGDIMRAGQADRDDYDRVNDMRVRIRVAVDDHRARLAVVVDADGMHGECADHHDEMSRLFDDTEAALATGGMMGGMM